MGYFIKKKQLWLSTEELVEDNDVVAIPVGDVDVDSVNSEIDRLTEIANTLRNISGNIHASMERGGLTGGEAKGYAIALNSVGKQDTELAVDQISIESFENETTREQATGLSLESIGRTIKKVYIYILKALKKLGRRLVNVYEKLKNGIQKGEKQAKSIEERISDIKAKQLPGVKVDVNDFTVGFLSKPKAGIDIRWALFQWKSYAYQVSILAGNIPSIVKVFKAAAQKVAVDGLESIDVDNLSKPAGQFVPDNSFQVGVWDIKTVINADKMPFFPGLIQKSPMAPTTMDVLPISEIVALNKEIKSTLKVLEDARATEQRVLPEVDSIYNAVKEYAEKAGVNTQSSGYYNDATNLVATARGWMTYCGNAMSRATDACNVTLVLLSDMLTKYENAGK